jgi:hypothetical protein
MIETVPSVLKAEILYNDGFFFVHEFGVKVLFKSGDTLRLRRVLMGGAGET